MAIKIVWCVIHSTLAATTRICNLQSSNRTHTHKREKQYLQIFLYANILLYCRWCDLHSDGKSIIYWWLRKNILICYTSKAGRNWGSTLELVCIRDCLCTLSALHCNDSIRRENRRRAVPFIVWSFLLWAPIALPAGLQSSIICTLGMQFSYTKKQIYVYLMFRWCHTTSWTIWG